MKRFILAAIAGAIVSSSTPAFADTTLHIDAATIVKSGAGSKAVILIPGLSCGPFVYDNVVRELGERFTVYTISFAGFDGNAPVNPPYLDAFTRSVSELITQEKLVRPLVVGHSLGGHIAVHIAEIAPDSVGAVLAVDTLPLFPPPRDGETPAIRKAQLTGFLQAMQMQSDLDYAATQRKTLAYLTAGQNVDVVTRHALRSDRMTSIGAAGEMMAEDLRPDLAKINVPVEVLVPVSSAPQADSVVSYYTKLYSGTKKLTTVPVVDSKHFIMLDQPQAFRTALDAFVDANANTNTNVDTNANTK